MHRTLRSVLESVGIFSKTSPSLSPSLCLSQRQGVSKVLCFCSRHVTREMVWNSFTTTWPIVLFDNVWVLSDFLELLVVTGEQHRWMVMIHLWMVFPQVMVYVKSLEKGRKRRAITPQQHSTWKAGSFRFALAKTAKIRSSNSTKDNLHYLFHPNVMFSFSDVFPPVWVIRDTVWVSRFMVPSVCPFEVS